MVKVSYCDSFVIIKCNESLLQNPSGFYYKMRQFYYECDNSIEKCDIYYKIQVLFQKSLVQVLRINPWSIWYIGKHFKVNDPNKKIDPTNKISNRVSHIALGNTKGMTLSWEPSRTEVSKHSK